MKLALVLFFVCAAFAAPSVDEISKDEVEGDAQAAFYNPMMGYPGMGGMMDPMMMGYPGMMGGMGGMYPMMNYPGMNSMYYSSNREDYPIDYSHGCSSSCSCMQTCRMIWWRPCTCRCPPPCPPPPPPPCNGGNGCSCNPCSGPVWMCPPRCCCCNGGCQENPQAPQDPEIPEFPFPREEEHEDEPRFPILEEILRDRFGARNDKDRENHPRLPGDIVIRWKD